MHEKVYRAHGQVGQLDLLFDLSYGFTTDLNLRGGECRSLCHRRVKDDGEEPYYRAWSLGAGTR